MVLSFGALRASAAPSTAAVFDQRAELFVMAEPEIWQYQYQVVSSKKSMDDLVLSGALSSDNWVLLTAGSARRVHEHMEKILLSKDGQHDEVMGAEILLTEDGFSYFKFVVVEISSSLMIRYKAKHTPVEMVVKRVYRNGVDTELVYNRQTPSSPKLKVMASFSGDLLGTVTFGWKDRWCDVLDACKIKAAEFIGTLTEPERRVTKVLHDGLATETHKKIVTPAHKWLRMIGKDVPEEVVVKNTKALLKPLPKKGNKPKPAAKVAGSSSSAKSPREGGRKILKKPAKK